MSTAPRLYRQTARLCLALAVCLLVGRGVVGAEPKVDPKAQEVLDAFGKFFSEAKGLRFTDTVTVYVQQQEQELTREFVQQISAERPNRFVYRLDSEQGGAEVTSDGQQLAVYLNGTGRYAVQEAPESWAKMLDNQIVLGTVGLGNAVIVTAALLSDDPAAQLVKTATEVTYGGLVEIDGVKCHHLQAATENLDWQIWIDAGDQPLVRQFVPDLQKAFTRMAKASKQNSPLANMKVTNTVIYSDWEIDPKFAPDAFAFHAPESATEVESFEELLALPGRPSTPPISPLLGKPAPPVDLALLDGGQLDLPSYKNKNVVILDFWATWCGPCVEAMPVIDKVAERFADKGVKLFAVNVQESADDIRAFLEEAKLDVAVAMDTEGEAAAAYRANAIPQTVLIGKDGTVQVVKIGLSPALEQELTASLEALLAGEDLAAKTIAKAKQAAKPASAEESSENGESPSDK